jgi:spermidine/putrescine transport system permease protein
MANNVITRSIYHEQDTVRINRSRMARGIFAQKLGKVGFNMVSVGGFLFLWLPILILVFYSFNDSRQLNEFQGFTFQWYENIFQNIAGGNSEFSTRLMMQSFGNSLFVSLTATVIATIIGTMVALSLARGKFFGRRFVDSLLFLPVVIPEITQGISLAIFFQVMFQLVKSLDGPTMNYGFMTIIIGHIAFNISYVAIVVRARLANMNPRLEEAAYDLGANGWQTFWRITFPQILPGVISGALLAFTLSLDDYVVTFFNNGPGTTTLPIYVYGMLKTSISPEINAISTLILGLSAVIVVSSLLMQRNYAAHR